MKPTILLDMDGVFADFVTGFYHVLESQYPEARSYFAHPSELKKFYIEDNLLDERGNAVTELICNNIETFRSAPPFAGALEGMNLLRAMCLERNADVHICTAPHITNLPCYTQKAEWVAKHLDQDWVNRLIITRDKTLVRGHVLVDDKPEPLGKHKPMWDHVLFTRSYNVDLPKLRIDDWSEQSCKLLVEHAFAKAML